MATKISTCYRQYAVERMSINITEDEMYILLPSENDDQVYYRVGVVEETLEPVKCGCKGFSRWGKCKHFTIVAEAFAGYKPVATPVVEAPAQEDETPVVEQEPRITEVEAGSWFIINKNTSVWRDDETGKWFAIGPTANALEIVLSYLDKQKAVAEAEQIVAQSQEVVSPEKEVSKITDISTKGALTRNTGFELLKVS